MGEKLRKSEIDSGIDILGDLKWGTHFCLFHQMPEDLMDILIPYFKAGLENNELCIWVNPEFRKAKEAIKNLREVIP